MSSGWSPNSTIITKTGQHSASPGTGGPFEVHFTDRSITVPTAYEHVLHRERARYTGSNDQPLINTASGNTYRDLSGSIVVFWTI
jgi:hypothetical protein